jgi:hypothetical protein
MAQFSASKGDIFDLTQSVINGAELDEGSNLFLAML